jgi:hypothetical protein
MKAKKTSITITNTDKLLKAILAYDLKVYRMKQNQNIASNRA